MGTSATVAVAVATIIRGMQWPARRSEMSRHGMPRGNLVREHDARGRHGDAREAAGHRSLSMGVPDGQPRLKARSNLLSGSFTSHDCNCGTESVTSRSTRHAMEIAS